MTARSPGVICSHHAGPFSGNHLPVPPGPAADVAHPTHHSGRLAGGGPARRLPADAAALLQVSGAAGAPQVGHARPVERL